VHIDLVGKLLVFCGFRYCLTAIDRHTRWSEAFPLSEITAEAVAKAFDSVWVASFDHPRKSQPTRAGNVLARLFKTLATIIGSSLTRTTAWHPASNGMIEGLHRPLKAALIYHEDEHWAKALQLVMTGIRSALKDLKFSSVEFVYGSPVRLSEELFAPSSAVCTDVTDFTSGLRVHTENLLPVPVSRHVAPPTFIFKDLATAPHVFLREGTPGDPSKLRMSVHIRSSTGAIRPIPSGFKVLRRQSP